MTLQVSAPDEGRPPEKACLTAMNGNQVEKGSYPAMGEPLLLQRGRG
ncbi:hypothetical protein [Chitinophaga rhizosphaerae]|nr:hypothetical protein [Chitinophaga rhizosphaerae]